MPEIPLVNSQVQEHLERLIDRQATAGFHFVELMGPSGTGKSRTLRELYRHLAEQQRQPAYWPPLANPNEGGHEPLGVRKLIGPPHHSVAAAPDALPDYLWVSVTAGVRSDNVPIATLPQFLDQLELHAVPLALAVVRRHSIREHGRWGWQEVVQAIRDEATENIDEQATELLSSLLNTAVPGVGSMIALARRASTRAKNYKENKATVAEGYELQLDKKDLVDQILQHLRHLHNADIRTVIVVEDAHLVDEPFAQLLIALRDEQLDAVVVTTVWPEGIARPAYRRLRTELTTPTGARSPDATLIKFDDWTSAQLEALVRALYSGTSSRTTRAVAEHFNTPLTVLLALGLDKVRYAVAGDSLQLEPEDIRELANNLGDLMAQRWAELHEDVRDALVLTMAMTGAQGFEDGLRFVRTVITEVGGRDRPGISDELATALSEALWLTELADGVEGYREPLLAGIVSREVAKRYWKRQLDALATELWNALERRIDTIPLAGHHSHGDVLARWALTVAARVPNAKAATVLRAQCIVARASLRTHQPTDAANVITQMDESSADDTETRLEVARLRYESARDSTALEDAIDHGERLIELLDAQGAAGRAESFQVRHEVAHWRRTCGDFHQALQAYQQILTELEVQDPPPFGDIILVQLEIASVIGYAGDPAEATRRVEVAEAECRTRLGRHDTLTLRATRMRWRWAGAAGLTMTAISGLRDLHPDMVTVHGAHHPATLFVLSNWAYFAVQSGDADAALELYEHCLVGRRAVLGRRHPHTLDTERNLARVRDLVEGPQAGIRAYRDLLATTLRDQLTSPIANAVRFHLVIALVRDDRLDDAHEQFLTLVGELGDAPIREDLMRTIGEYGDVPALKDRLRLLRKSFRKHPAHDEGRQAATKLSAVLAAG